MKLLGTFLAVTAFAQTTETTTGLSSLERGKKKKNKNSYAATEPETTVVPDTTADPVTTSGNDDDDDNNNNYAPGGGSSGYGDPHFHILGRSDDQPDICFDFNEEPGTQLTLIQDNQTGFQAVGTLFRALDNEKRVYFKDVRVTSPHNTELSVDGQGWSVNTHARVNPSFNWSTETLSYADMILGDFHKENHGGHKMTVTIKGGVTFEIQSATAHNNINFKLLDHSLLSSDVEGIIGRFLKEGAYKVLSENGREGMFYYKDKAIPVTFQRHAHNKECWTMNTFNAKDLIQNTSK